MPKIPYKDQPPEVQRKIDREKAIIEWLTIGLGALVVLGPFLWSLAR